MTELPSTEQAAQMLGVTAGTLAVWRSTRRYPLKFVRIGRKVRYRTADLEAFITDRTVSGIDESNGRRDTSRASRCKAS
jgi:excisionase family DNA binding protein